MRNVYNGDLQQIGVPNVISASQAYPQNKILNFDKFTTVQKNINEAVIEYLLKNGLMRSVDVFQEEIMSSKASGL